MNKNNEYSGLYRQSIINPRMLKIFRTPFFFRWIFRRRIWGFSVSDKVFLTFDDGPTSELTGWILTFLADNNIKATFFCVGENVGKYPKVYERIIAEGHVAGNHTMRHTKSSSVVKEEYFSSVNAASEVIQSSLFRPPYGRLPLSYDKRLNQDYRIVMWSWLSHDYDREVPVEEIVRKAESIRGGDIIVMHDNIKVEDRIKIILPELISIIKQKGLKFGLISV